LAPAVDDLVWQPHGLEQVAAASIPDNILSHAEGHEPLEDHPAKIGSQSRTAFPTTM
jgi:hypothetical protein